MDGLRMIFHLGLLGWSAGLVAVGLMVVQPQQPRPVFGEGAPGSLAPPLPAPVEEALATLRKADLLSTARVGIAAGLTEEAAAWQVLYLSPEAPALFLRLFESSALAGRLYALTGLRAVGPADFAERLTARDAWWPERVNIVRGCVFGEERVDGILREIESGWWTANLLGPLREERGAI